MRFRPLLLLPLLALAGCAVGPDYQRPASAMASHDWIEPASTAPVDAKWWEQFGDPTLTGLIERALAASPDLKQATARIAEARALREAAQGGLGPQVNASGGATLNKASENGQIPIGNIPGFDPTYPLIDAGFDASWEIDLWGKASRTIEQARGQEGAAEWARRDAVVSLTAEIARTYIEFRRAQEDLASATAEQEASASIAELASLRLDHGEGSRLEADQAVADLEARKALLAQARSDVSGSAYRLAALVGSPPEDLVPSLLASSAMVPLPPAAIASGIRSDLLERRPDIRIAEQDLAAATAGIGVAKADLYPRISLLGTIGVQAQHADDLTDSGSIRYSVGPSFHWPIFAMGRVRAQIRAAGARADQQAAAYEGALVKALSETEGAANRYAASVAAAPNVHASLAREREAYALAHMLFDRGETSRIQLDQARLRLAGAERKEAEARAVRASSAIALYKALGGGWQGAGAAD
ncbi:MAG: efflux transporter outer membrane subunit [Candidatus Andeanibacterium colombiense]|uniref:Efflux transporter outer membrane subunit n=1 Tax=Candidatus Andeanibacterium colombiense TaxID=3121345 RepID=A0AAJ5X9M5_9SPHN|nr:MAG: efflux transporter outer membrane subunit [Sphingomonadaceae bacterium]